VHVHIIERQAGLGDSTNLRV